MDKQFTTLGNGTTLAYLERPGGEIPLVLLHGVTDSSLTYEPLLPRISWSCHVYALDHRGHGDSSRPAGVYHAESYADDVRCFIREKIGGPVQLAGHSLGGLVAVQVAATAPDMVTSLFLEDPPLYFVGNMSDTYRNIFNGIMGMARGLQDGSLPREQCFEIMARAPDPWSGKPGIETQGEAKINQRIDVIAKMDPRVLGDSLEGDSLVWDTDAVLADVSCPVTMMNGNEALGAVITPGETAQVQRIVARCSVLVQDNVGHLVHEQQPDAWLTAVNDWVS